MVIMTRRLFVALAVASGATLGCNRKPAPPPAPPAANVVTITAKDFSFDAPDTIPAGVTTVKFHNAGKENHQVVFIRIDSGKTMADIANVMKDPNAKVPAWMNFPLGANTITPGDSGNATAPLIAGNYVLICFVGSPDGTPHANKGMVKPVVVKASTGPMAAEPTADITITAKDYTWDISAPITAGTHTFRVENAGPQVHEIQILQFAPGKTVKDLQTWVAGGMKGNPPAKEVGGFVGPMPGAGEHGFFTATLAAGKYAFICFVPDMKDAKPHLIHGMVKEVTVS
jgi:plastocyanin